MSLDYEHGEEGFRGWYEELEQNEKQKGGKRMAERRKKTGMSRGSGAGNAESGSGRRKSLPEKVVQKAMIGGVTIVFLCAVVLCALLAVAGVIGAVRLVQFLCAGLSLV